MPHDRAPRIHPMTCPCARCRAPYHDLAALSLRARLIIATGAIGAGILIALLAC